MTYGLGVTTFTTHQLLAPGLATFLLVIMCYIAGRVHQFFRQTTEREQAFRDGYNTATRSLFSLATRSAKALPAPRETVQMRPGFASVPHESRSPLPARHRAGGRRDKSLADTRKLSTELPEARAA